MSKWLVYVCWILGGALLGTLLLTFGIGYIMFGIVGPSVQRKSMDDSTVGIWPLVSFVYTVIAALAGAAIGATGGAITAAVLTRKGKHEDKPAPDQVGETIAHQLPNPNPQIDNEASDGN